MRVSEKGVDPSRRLFSHDEIVVERVLGAVYVELQPVWVGLKGDISTILRDGSICGLTHLFLRLCCRITRIPIPHEYVGLSAACAHEHDKLPLS